jgi:hypothetical protein
MMNAVTHTAVKEVCAFSAGRDRLEAEVAECNMLPEACLQISDHRSSSSRAFMPSCDIEALAKVSKSLRCAEVWM